MNFYDHIKTLHNAGLHEDVRLLCSLGNALVHGGEYRKAEVQYKKALQIKKTLNKGKSKAVSNVESTSEVDVRFKIHECLCHLKQHREAVAVLEGINSKQRTSKVNMALAKLYQKTGMDRSAVTCFKEVLRECPLALEAVLGLLSLGVRGAEVASLVLHGVHGGCEWLSHWIKGHAFIANKEYSHAVSTFKGLDAKVLRNSTELLCSLGEAHFLNGDYAQAQLALERAHTAEPLMLKNMDTLAYLYAREKKTKELESLGNQLMSVSEQAPQPWVAIGYFCLLTEKRTRAVYFAQKAYTLDNRCLEALLLKGQGLLELKKNQDAIMHYREALRLAPGRYEPYKGIIDCYIASHRMREAIQMGSSSIKQLGQNARSLTLYGSVLAKDQLTLEKAKSVLELALKFDSLHLDAVYVMADIYTRQQQWEKGIDMLRNQLQHQSTCRLHQLLGDFLSQTNEKQEALDQYSIALSLDPGNKQAREGMERVEKNTEVGLESAYDLEVEDMDGTDNDMDLDGSDVESAWSDVSGYS
ncbi:anaphase-promoting complex subunit 7 [Lingula anatina]|uniref:Anaphase-promoting complex subunit 7 n=1 Tax=Lingula anatina TaxID=7574 RepID=A0A1S3HEJ8_LINAN|nr:anaphase-promoting complex subunit 7 [Lingula anatina]|eukprot:XP_013384483.1 anaphase-promoting complex subunit 7 [Lingula anatina]